MLQALLAGKRSVTEMFLNLKQKFLWLFKKNLVHIWGRAFKLVVGGGGGGGGDGGGGVIL